MSATNIPLYLMVTLKDPGSLQNFLPALRVLKRERSVLLIVYFDDLVKLSKNFRECFDNMFKIAKMCYSLQFVIDLGKSIFKVTIREITKISVKICPSLIAVPLWKITLHSP